MYRGIIDRYGHLLAPESQVKPENVITLGEGNTPLVPLNHLKNNFGIEAIVHVKIEGANPTCSFKDRGMTVAVSRAYEERRLATICASTGNTSASGAAYSARAGLKAYVLLPSENIPFTKVLQAVDYGAKIIRVDGNFDTAMALAIELEKTGKAVLVNSLNPHRIQGQQTVAFEVVDDLGRAPDIHFYPVGNGLNGAAHWLGYKEMERLGKSGDLPMMIGVQAEGAAAMVYDVDLEHPDTIATAIRIGKPVNRKVAKDAVYESRGCFVTVTDNEIIAARNYLAKQEGISCEPASAASLAGLIKLHQEGTLALDPEKLVVLTLTGGGLKDTGIIERTNKFDPNRIVPATLEEVMKVLRW